MVMALTVEQLGAEYLLPSQQVPVLAPNYLLLPRSEYICTLLAFASVILLLNSLEEILDGGAGGGRGEGGRRGFAPSALSLFHFHLSPFPPETPDTQAIFSNSRCYNVTQSRTLNLLLAFEFLVQFSLPLRKSMKQ